jgi:hypothetical protein
LLRPVFAHSAAHLSKGDEAALLLEKLSQTPYAKRRKYGKIQRSLNDTAGGVN